MAIANFDIDNLVIEGVESEFEILPEGMYDCEITDLQQFSSTDSVGETFPAMKVGFRVITGDWANETLDTIISLYRTDKTGRLVKDANNDLIRKDITNDKYKLHELWKAAMGETPIIGGKYRIPDLKGKRLQVVVKHKPNQKGQVWPRPDGYLPAAQSRRRGQVAVVVDEVSDQLRDA